MIEDHPHVFKTRLTGHQTQHRDIVIDPRFAITQTTQIFQTGKADIDTGQALSTTKLHRRNETAGIDQMPAAFTLDKAMQTTFATGAFIKKLPRRFLATEFSAVINAHGDYDVMKTYKL